MFNYNNSSVIYVSQLNGDDALCNGLTPTNNGYGNGPFKTLKRALNVIGQNQSSGLLRPMTIRLVDDYYLSETIKLYIDKILAFNLIPSQGVTIESYGERKKIVGGIKISNWKNGQFNGKKCICAELPPKSDGSSWDFVDLFVNGKRADNTRYPLSGTLEAIDTENNFDKNSPIPLAVPSKWIIANKKDFENLEGIETASLHFNHYWVDEHTAIESYDAATGKLEFKYPSRFTITTNYGEKEHTSAIHYHLENVPTMFANKNEWYLDRESSIVYYIPENDDINLKEIEAYAPVLEKLFEIYGDDDKKIKDIRLNNLELIFTRSDYVSKYERSKVSNKYTEIADADKGFGADNQSACFAHGAVSFKNAERCIVSHCLIKGIGTHAIEIKTGCKNVRVENNIFDDLGGGAVRIFGGDADSEPYEMTENCIIRGNKITNCGRKLAAACGILVCHANNNEITDNEIAYTEYSGISVGWIWGYVESTCYGNIISRNHVHHIGVGRLSDMGGIYLLGKQQGTVVSYNRIHDVSCAHYGGYGIYTDEGSSYIIIENNVVFNTKSECYYHHYGKQNVVRNNIFAFGDSCVKVARNENFDGVLLESNIFITDDKPAFGSWNNAIAATYKNNLYWDIANHKPTMYIEGEDKFDFIRWCEEIGADKGSVVSDPNLINISEFNFTLKENSPALKLGFVPISGFPATK